MGHHNSNNDGLPGVLKEPHLQRKAEHHDESGPRAFYMPFLRFHLRRFSLSRRACDLFEALPQ